MIFENLITLLEETKEMIPENKKAGLKLQEVLDIVHAIKNGNIDAVFMMNKKTANILVPKTADQTYRKFIEGMQQGVVTLLDDGTILYSNLSFSEMVDVPLEKVVGSNLRNYIPSIYIETFERFFDGFPAENFIVNISLSRINTSRHYMVSFNKLPLENLTALNLVWTDITDITQANEHLLNINEKLNNAIKEAIFIKTTAERTEKKTALNIKELNDLNAELASYAHQTATVFEEPVRKMSTYSSILLRDYSRDIKPEGQEYLAVLNRASVRMRQVINDIVQYSALLNQEVEFNPTSLQSVVNQVRAKLDPLIQKTKASIIVRRDLPVIDADAEQMVQLFQNILSNSLKFIETNVRPVVHIEYDIIKDDLIVNGNSGDTVPEYYKILISDNGIGFKPEFNERIFTMFEKLNNGFNLPGTGIGLAICKLVVKKHHGTVKAEGIENGSLFTIILPVHQPRP